MPELGLVLSGGGYRGAFEVGVLRCLDEAEIRVDAIAATSAGAIIGSLWAGGMAPPDILELMQETTIFKLSYFARGMPGLININKFRSVLEKYLPERFDAMPIPVRIAATNLANGRSKIFSDGSLIDAILASAAFPFVFPPVIIDDEPYSDGGILNNFPVEALRNDCNVVVGVNVTPLQRMDPAELDSMLDVAQRAYQLASRVRSVAKYEDCDLVIAPADSDYGTFDSKNVDELEKLGYTLTHEQLDRLKELLAA